MGIYAFQIVFAALPFFLRLVGWFPENESVWTYPLIWAHTVINVTVIVLFGIALGIFVLVVIILPSIRIIGPTQVGKNSLSAENSAAVRRFNLTIDP